MLRKFEKIKMHELENLFEGNLHLNYKTNNALLKFFWELNHSREVQQQTVPFVNKYKVKETPAEVINKRNVRFWSHRKSGI
jgi:hypothetical protein